MSEGIGYALGALALNRGALWGAAAGVLVVVGYYNFARSLKSGAVSTHATIFRLSFAVTVALAVLVLGEPLTTPKLAGLALVLVAVWLLLAVPGAASGDAHRERLSSLVAAQGAVAVTLSTAFSAYIDRRIRPSRAAWSHAPVAAVLLVVAFTFLAKGLERGEASVVVPVAQMGFVVIALLGFVLLREPFTLRKGAGLAAALAALASLARG